VTPHFNQVRYFDKPPLLYWLMSFSFSLFGLSEGSARFWPAAAAVLIALVTAHLGRVLYSARAGLIAGLAVVANLELFIFGRMIKPDSLFILVILIAYAGFLLAYQSGRQRYLWLFYGGVGLAVLSKDLLGAVGPLAVVALFLVLTRETAPRVRWFPLAGVGLALALAIPWHAVMDLKNPGFLSYVVIDNHILNFVRQRQFPDEDVPLSAAEFLGVTTLGFFPWSLALPWAFAYAFRRPWNDAVKRSSLLLGLWGGVVLVFFTLSPFKLPHYALPAFPAFALLVGKLWDDVLSRRPSAPTHRYLLALPLIGMIGLATVALIAWRGALPFPTGTLSMADLYTRNVGAKGLSPPLPTYEQLQPWFGATALVFGAGSLGLALAIRKKLPRAGLIILFATMFGFLPIASEGVVLLASQRSVKPLLAEITRRSRADELIIHEGALENSGSLILYSGKHVKIMDGRESTLAFGATFPEARSIFWNLSKFKAHWSDAPRLFLVTLEPPDRSVIKHLPSERVHLLASSGGRWLYSNQP
jgi:hypothetical protein